MTFPAIKSANTSIFFNVNSENMYLNASYQFILIPNQTGV